MSYVVHLWRDPAPSSLVEAEAVLLDRSRTTNVRPDPAARDLLAAITAGLPSTGDSDDWWNEVPELDSQGPVLSLAPAVAELGSVLPAIESAARRLGWVVYDPQAGEVRLPSGRVLTRAGVGFEAAAISSAPPDIDESRAARRVWLHQSLAPLFTRRGWSASQGNFCFKKKYAWGLAHVYSNMTGHTVLSHGIWLKLALPAHLKVALNSDGGPELRVSLRYFAENRGLAFLCREPSFAYEARVGLPAYELPFAGREQAHRCRDELHSLYDGPVLDWLDALTSLNDLEHWANRVPDADCPFVGLRHRNDGHRLLNYHPDLLLAAAVDAPDFEQRARERFALYEADAFGRSLLPQLRALLAVCGLNL